MTILVDGNAVGFAATASNKLTIGGKPVGGTYGFLRTLREIRQSFSGNLVVLWDGKSWRAQELTTYKANREANPDLVKLKAEWVSQRGEVAHALALLGVAQMRADNYEADDLAAITSRRLSKFTLVTGDRDWAQLWKPGSLWVDRVNARRIFDQESFEQIAKADSVQQFVEMKALTGDAGDNVPGVGGVGPTTAKELFERFGTVENAIFLAGDTDAVKPCSGRLKAFLTDPDKHARYRQNLKLVWLNHPDIPKPINLKLIQKPLDREGFDAFCTRRLFTSINNSLDVWLRPFEQKIRTAA